ncbi:MAG: hypothetical protein HY021_03380 [Burkholderiales bacterium]|nr:hypothetical protein [Burkholderiales bacterium]
MSLLMLLLLVLAGSWRVAGVALRLWRAVPRRNADFALPGADGGRPK